MSRSGLPPATAGISAHTSVILDLNALNWQGLVTFEVPTNCVSIALLMLLFTAQFQSDVSGRGSFPYKHLLNAHICGVEITA